jgi:hypothetical protein
MSFTDKEKRFWALVEDLQGEDFSDLEAMIEADAILEGVE